MAKAPKKTADEAEDTKPALPKFLRVTEDIGLPVKMPGTGVSVTLSYRQHQIVSDASVIKVLLRDVPDKVEEL